MFYHPHLFPTTYTKPKKKKNETEKNKVNKNFNSITTQTSTRSRLSHSAAQPRTQLLYENARRARGSIEPDLSPKREKNNPPAIFHTHTHIYPHYHHLHKQSPYQLAAVPLPPIRGEREGIREADALPCSRRDSPYIPGVSSITALGDK